MSDDILIFNPSFPYLDPTNYVFFFTDFISGAGATNTSQPSGLGSFQPSISGTGAVTVAANEAGCYGVMQAATGTTNASVAIITVGGNWGAAYNAAIFDMKFRLKASSTTSVGYFFGVNKNEAAGEVSTDFIGFAYDSSQDGTTWHAVTRSASGAVARTNIVGATVQTSAYATLRMRCVTAGTILFSVDGGAETAVSTGLPTVILAPQYSINTKAGTNNVNFKTDFFWHWYALQRGA